MQILCVPYTRVNKSLLLTLIFQYAPQKQRLCGKDSLVLLSLGIIIKTSPPRSMIRMYIQQSD